MPRERYDVIPVHLHLDGRDRPPRLVPIDLNPFGVIDLAWTNGGERQEAQGIADHVAEPRVVQGRGDVLKEPPHGIDRLGLMSR